MLYAERGPRRVAREHRAHPLRRRSNKDGEKPGSQVIAGLPAWCEKCTHEHRSANFVHLIPSEHGFPSEIDDLYGV